MDKFSRLLAGTMENLKKGDTPKTLQGISNLASASNSYEPSGGRRSGDTSAVDAKLLLLKNLTSIVAGQSCPSVADIALQVTPLSGITNNSRGFSTANISNANDILDQLSNCLSGNSIDTALAKTFISSTENVYSSIGEGRNRSAVQSLRAELTNTVLRVSKAVLHSKVPGEAMVDISSSPDNRLQVQRLSRTALLTEPLQTTNSSVSEGFASFTLPANFTKGLPNVPEVSGDSGLSQAVDVMLSANTVLLNKDEYTFKSRMYGLSVSLAPNSTVEPVVLTDGSTILMNISTNTSMPAGDSYCMYYDTAKGTFERDGMEETARSPGAAAGLVECSSTHLTDFAVTAAWAPSAAPCVYGNNSLYVNSSLDLVEISPADGTVSVLANTSITLRFSEMIKAGSGSIVLTPGQGQPMVIPVTDKQVSIANDTLVLTLAKGLPTTPTLSAFGAYSVSYPKGLVVKNSTAGTAEASLDQNVAPACCSRDFPTFHQASGSSNVPKVHYFGQLDVPQDFQIEFDLVLHSEQAEKLPIFSIGGADRQGPAIYQTAGAKSLYVRVDTELQPDNGASDVGLGDIELDTPYHWEIMMNSQGVLTIKQNGTNIKCTDLGSAKAISPNEPLFFGSDTAGSFTLSNLKVHQAQGFKFFVKETTIPAIVAKYPDGPGTPENPVTADTNIEFTFNTWVRPGVGVITLTSSSGTVTNIDINDPQVTFAGTKVTLNPGTDIPGALSSTITMEEGVIQSMGSWRPLFTGYAPAVAFALGCSQGLDEPACYDACRHNPECNAFKSGVSGANANRCCLYANYTLSLGSADSLVVTSPGEKFSELVATESGYSFGGLAGPDATIGGKISFGGDLTATDFEDPKLVQALKLTVCDVINNGTGADIPNVTESQVAVAPDAAESRRLLAGVTLSYTITLTPDQASAAPAAASSIATSLASDNPTFVAQFVDEAAAVGAVSAALNQFLSASGTTPTVTQGAGEFSFMVADSSGPTLVSQHPLHSATEIHPSFSITLTFSEGIQAGVGDVVLSNSAEHGTLRHIDVTSNRVVISDNTMVIYPRMWFLPGTITVTMASGVVTDDAHSGTATTNPFAGINDGEYMFDVAAISQPPPPTFLSIGMSPGSRACSYVMTSPWYTCGDFTECTLFVKPVGSACASSGASVQYKKVTMEALKTIAAHGFELNGGDGRDTILSYGNGGQWPDNVVASFGGSA